MEVAAPPTYSNWTLIKRFFAYYRPHRRLFVLDFSCAVVSGLLELGFPMAVRLFVDRLLPSQDWALILLAAAALLAIYLLNTGLMIIVNYWGHVLGINIETEMRRKSFDHLQKLSFRFYDNQKTGHLVGARDEGPGGDRRGRPPRPGRRVHRGHDLPRRVRADVHASMPKLALITGADRAADDLALHALRQAR